MAANALLSRSLQQRANGGDGMESEDSNNLAYLLANALGGILDIESNHHSPKHADMMQLKIHAAAALTELAAMDPPRRRPVR